MISHSEKKLLNKLKLKKYRHQEGLYLVEGIKTIERLVLNGIEPVKVWINEAIEKQNIAYLEQIEYQLISDKELKEVSDWKTPEGVIAIFPKPSQANFQFKGKMVMVADRIQDPGNLGTMYRILDWFGGKQMIVLKGTVDPFNSKTVQASMGAVGVVETIELEEKELFSLGLPIYAASMEGEDVFQIKEQPDNGLMVFGNESKGVSEIFRNGCTKMFSIPGGESGQESLNVGVSAGILYGILGRN